MVVSGGGSGTQVFDAGRRSRYPELQTQLQPFGLEQYGVAFAGAVHVTGLPPQEPELLHTSPVVQALPSSHEMPAATTHTYLPAEHVARRQLPPQSGGSPLQIARAAWAVAHSR